MSRWSEDAARDHLRRQGLDPDAWLREGRRVPLDQAQGSTPAPRRRRRTTTRTQEGGPLESELHGAVAALLDRAGLRWHHSPLEGRRGKGEAAVLHAHGARAGWPDLVITTPTRLGWRGVAIELKARRNRPTPAQWDWLEGLHEDGWLVAVCRSVDEVRAVLAVCWPGRVEDLPPVEHAWATLWRCVGEALERLDGP